MVSLNKYPTSHLVRELEKRERDAKKLESRRDQLRRQLEAIDKELATVGGSSGARGRRGVGPRRGRKPGRPAGTRRRARNDISLPDAVAQAMEIRAVVTPAEAAKLVKANGYKTTAKNFNMMVSNALAKDKRFKRIARGQYERIS